MWEYTGTTRPFFAEVTGPDQESVWDYPRPPRLVIDRREVVVQYRDLILASSEATLRVLETAGPPTFYIPVRDVDTTKLKPTADSSWCEWKGTARYFSLNTPDSPDVTIAWSYPTPNESYSKIKEHLSFYPGRVECYVDNERVQPQAGGFYGGWITREIVGPIKGDPGTEEW